MGRRKITTRRHDLPPRPAVLARRWRDWLAQRNGKDGPRRLLFFPEPPKPQTLISKVCAAEGWEIETDPGRPCDHALRWQDRTRVGAPRVLRALDAIVPVVNLACTDISKRAVDRAYHAAFGRSLLVDPTTTEGRLVEKSDRNARHDGRVVQGPVPRRRRRIYSRLVDNRVDGEQVEDLRVVVAMGEIPLVYAKRRPLASRFSNTNASAVLREPDDVLSTDEQARVLALARHLGLDLGELDVLRDRDDGLLYVVDVANTPFGPPNHIAEHEGADAVARIGASVRRGLDGRRIRT